MVTEAETQTILAEQKVIGANLSWTADGVIQRLEAKVLCVESEEILTLKGTRGRPTVASSSCTRTRQYVNTPSTPTTETRQHGK